jgi:hypothetical protein
MELPTERQQVTDYNPSLMVLFGKPKSGKSTIAAALDNALIIDLEDGYRSLPVMRVKARSAKDLLEVKKAIIQKAKELGKYPYKYIVLDNATRLEEMALPVAADLYRNTSMGANWKTRLDEKTGQRVPEKNADVRLLPNGSGYLYLRNAVKNLVGMFMGLCDTLILVAHVKEKQIRKDAEEVSELTVDLAGKLADIICGEADAVGLVYRDKNKTYISFKGGDGTLKEARPLHLRGKVFEVASSDDNNTVTVDLSKVFI